MSISKTIFVLTQVFFFFFSHNGRNGLPYWEGTVRSRAVGLGESHWVDDKKHFTTVK